MLYGLQTRISKEINPKVVKNSMKKDKSKRLPLKIREYDNLKKLINNFMKKNFSYISYVHGGFKEIHDQSLKFEIPLLNHDDSCYICRKNKKKDKKGFFNKLFRSDKSNIYISNFKESNTISNKENKDKISRKESSLEPKDVNILSKLEI
jgi:hypothetical protein